MNILKINKFRKLALAVLLSSFANSFAQELVVPVATHYLADNPFVISPTYAGIGDNIRIRLNGFGQWMGVKEHPQNQALYADFRVLEQSGVGIMLYSDRNGFTQQTGGRLTFAHHIILDYPTKQYLSFGLSYNLNNFRIQTDKFNIFDASIVDDRYVANNNFDVGLLYRKGNLFAAFNAGNILNKDTKKFYFTEPSKLRIYQLYLGYTYRANRNARMEFEPSGYFQHMESDGRTVADVNVKLRYLDNQRTGYFWLGGTYRTLLDQPGKPLTVGPMLGLKKGGLYVGYSYQLTLNELAAYNSGTHMITLGYDFFQGLSNCPCTQTAVSDD